MAIDILGALDLIDHVEEIELTIYEVDIATGTYVRDQNGLAKKGSARLRAFLDVEFFDLKRPSSARYAVSLRLEKWGAADLSGIGYQDFWDDELRKNLRYYYESSGTPDDRAALSIVEVAEGMTTAYPKGRPKDRQGEDNWQGSGDVASIQWSRPIRCPSSAKTDIWLIYADLKYFGGRSWGHWRFRWNYKRDTSLELSGLDSFPGDKVPLNMVSGFTDSTVWIQSEPDKPAPQAP